MRIYVSLCIYPTLCIIFQPIFYSVCILLCVYFIPCAFHFVYILLRVYSTLYISHSVCVLIHVYPICISSVYIPLFVYSILCVTYFVYLILSCFMCILLPMYSISCKLSKLLPFDLRLSGNQKFSTITVSLRSSIVRVIYCNNRPLQQLSIVMDCNGQVTHYKDHQLLFTASGIVKEQLLKHLIFV